MTCMKLASYTVYDAELFQYWIARTTWHSEEGRGTTTKRGLRKTDVTIRSGDYVKTPPGRLESYMV